MKTFNQLRYKIGWYVSAVILIIALILWLIELIFHIPVTRWIQSYL